MHHYRRWAAYRRPAFAWAGCDPGMSSWGWERFAMAVDGESGGAFGVRRPLRFLAFKLGLREEQVAELAKVLSDLKIERLQAEADRRRTVSAFADAIAADVFDERRASEGAELRVESAGRLREAVLRALRRIHELLDPEQRERLAYLIRTGRLTL